MTKLYKNVYVCTGPLYLAKREVDGKMYIRYQVIGDNQVAVPTHFFKVVVGEMSNKQLELESYVLPNEPIPDNVALATFQVKIKHAFQFVSVTKELTCKNGFKLTCPVMQSNVGTSFSDDFFFVFAVSRQ